MDRTCIYLTSDGYCDLHSDGVELREPCLYSPCGDEKYAESEGEQDE